MQYAITYACKERRQEGRTEDGKGFHSPTPTQHAYPLRCLGLDPVPIRTRCRKLELGQALNNTVSIRTEQRLQKKRKPDGAGERERGSQGSPLQARCEARNASFFVPNFCRTCPSFLPSFLPPFLPSSLPFCLRRCMNEPGDLPSAPQASNQYVHLKTPPSTPT